ncbi:STAS/SEC14 domain-containing protein [uncultured Pontibacter sp.]|uniref:STAS/SEC14 domain-containing protein n=1 Tax=uncultured Pontibacter sp. TaxID=453356 RepID=UPI002632C8BD|nr:STAS/SEC14 domain-containing protein [uncultured Pontibacter sp.]
MQHLTTFRELITSTGKPYLTIYYNEQHNWVYNNWIGYVTPDNVKQGSLAVLDALETYHTPLGLNDNRELVGPWDQVVGWIETEWIPRAEKAGLQFYALVVDAEAFAAASAAKMLNKVHNKFDMRIFNDITAAEDWLQKCTLKVK